MLLHDHFQPSYGVGSRILLDRPLRSAHQLILAAVTSQRAGEGLQAQIHSIFQAVNQIHNIMRDSRFRKVYLPIMGAGHGCLTKEVALFSLVLAWAEILCGPRSPHYEVNIISYKADDNTKPKLNPRAVKQILRTATGMFKL